MLSFIERQKIMKLEYMSNACLRLDDSKIVVTELNRWDWSWKNSVIQNWLNLRNYVLIFFVSGICY